MADFITREEHDRDIEHLHERITRTEQLLHDRFTHMVDRLEDHLHSQDVWLRGIFATVIAFAILHFVFHVG